MPQTIAMTMLRTPLGEVLAVTSARGVCALECPRPTRRRWFPDAEIVEAAPDPPAPIGDWLDRYFAGARPRAFDISLDLRGTSFELSVWQALLDILRWGSHKI